jgi:hypothetical protein
MNPPNEEEKKKALHEINQQLNQARESINNYWREFYGNDYGKDKPSLKFQIVHDHSSPYVQKVEDIKPGVEIIDVNE